MNRQVIGSPRLVHKAGAAVGLAGRVCGFGGPGWMLAHPDGSPLYDDLHSESSRSGYGQKGQ